MPVPRRRNPVFLAYRKHDGISRIIREWIKFHKPEYDFTTEDGVTHILWPVAEPSTVEAIRKGFEEVEALYIADGHHRHGLQRRRLGQTPEGTPGLYGAGRI